MSCPSISIHIMLFTCLMLFAVVPSGLNNTEGENNGRLFLLYACISSFSINFLNYACLLITSSALVVNASCNVISVGCLSYTLFK